VRDLGGHKPKGIIVNAVMLKITDYIFNNFKIIRFEIGQYFYCNRRSLVIIIHQSQHVLLKLLQRCIQFLDGFRNYTHQRTKIYLRMNRRLKNNEYQTQILINYSLCRIHFSGIFGFFKSRYSSCCKSSRAEARIR
jgi:hypothetical protein